MTAKKAKKLKQTFQLDAPGASMVLLAGEFTGWESEPIQMKKDRKGLWKATVSLPPGTHRYRFVVDGCWTTDPSATTRESNPFGSENSVRDVAAA